VSDAEFQDVVRGKKDIQAQNPRNTARLSDTTKEVGAGLRTNKRALEEGNQENNNSDDEDEEEEKSLDGKLNFEETTSLHSGEEEGGSFPEEPVVGL
jgi:Sec-independent protein translocase protein TatA